VPIGSVRQVTAPVLTVQRPQDLLDAVAAERRGLDLTGAVVHDEGYENAVVETADGWILRFPRLAGLPFEREVAILARLAGRLPVEIPRIAWTGRHSRFAAYRKLTGAMFDVDAYLAAPPAGRDVLAGSLAAFLAAMHDALSVAEVAELGIPAVPYADLSGLVGAALPRLSAPRRAVAEALLEPYRAHWTARPAGPEVVLHNDFHHHNLVFTGPVGELTGIWDFSCVEVGSPSWELRYLHRYPRDLIERVAGHYTAATGRVVDVEAAVAAGRLERIQDAVLDADPAVFDAVVARWQLDVRPAG
jgi:aminoglycoside phosphotransferase (APT) family kinase protein